MSKRNKPKCYFGCPVDGPLHKPPFWEYPFTERFNEWKKVLDLETQEKGNSYIHYNIRLCYRHFEDFFKSKHSNRLTKNAVPSLNLGRRQISPLTTAVEELVYVTPGTSAGTNILECLKTTAVEELANVTPGTSAGTNVLECLKRTDSLCTKKTPFINRKQKECNLKLKEKIQKMKRKFKSQVAGAKRLTETKHFNSIIKNMPESIQLFTRMQMQYRKKPRGRKFTIDEKIMALSIFKQGPKAYAFLRKCFVLPSSRTLKKLLCAICFAPGINKHILENLKDVVKKLPKEKRFVNLLFDEMSLQPGLTYNATSDEIVGFEDFGIQKNRKIADHAIVFMFKGIKGKTKQPICYAFCQSSTKKEILKELLVTIIRELRDAGLTVIASVCDQSTTNVSVIKSLQEDTKAHYYRENRVYNSNAFEVDQIKVYPLFDTPHLLKGVRNNFLSKNVIFKQNNELKTAKWEHLIMLLEKDKGEDEIRLLNKLTENHIVKEKIPKMKVKFAAQVFSQRVSAVMRFLARHGILSPECEETADFLLIFDKLFDSFNGHSYQDQSKLYKSCIRINSPHFKLWDDLLPILESIKFQSIKKINGVEVIKHESIPSIKNWIKNIKCFKEMFKDLYENHKVKNLIPRNFNQDPLENFFSCIRSHGARNVNPTCLQFMHAFKTLIINNFNSPHSPGANCEKDNDQCLQSLKQLITGQHGISPPDFACNIDSLLDMIVNFKNNEASSLVHLESKKYVAGYIIKKCKSKISKTCKTCNHDLCRSEVDYNSFNFEIDYTKKSLFHPSDQLIKILNELYYVIVLCLRQMSPQFLKAKIKFYIDIACDFDMITCSEHKADLINFIKNLACNIIIYSWCNSVNRILNGKFLKFDENDLVKKEAFIYFCKRRKIKK